MHVQNCCQQLKWWKGHVVEGMIVNSVVPSTKQTTTWNPIWSTNTTWNYVTYVKCHSGALKNLRSTSIMTVCVDVVTRGVKTLTHFLSWIKYIMVYPKLLDINMYLYAKHYIFFPRYFWTVLVFASPGCTCVCLWVEVGAGAGHSKLFFF